MIDKTASRRLLVTAVSACMLMFTGAASAGAKALQFFTVATPEQEVAATPVESDSTAVGVVFFDSGLTRAHVRIDLRGPITPLAAHFHCGRAGANGDVAVGLLAPGETFGDPRRVTITNEDFAGADCTDEIGRPVNNIAALALAMRDGLIYLNLHSAASPAGEVRGQMLEF